MATATDKKKPTTTRREQGTRDVICRTVELQGITPIMFDPYPGDNETKLRPEQKLYFAADGSTIVLPSTNIMSFLSAENTESAPKRCLDSRKYKRFAKAAGSFVQITPLDADAADEYSEDIPFTRNGKPLVFTKFDDHERCPTSSAFIHRAVARLKDGIPNPKVRVLLPLPWELTFRLTMFPNPMLQEQQLRNVFELGAVAVGFGTWRGRFGKCAIVRWE